jgi:hypothetical protein
MNFVIVLVHPKFLQVCTLSVMYATCTMKVLFVKAWTAFAEKCYNWAVTTVPNKHDYSDCNSNFVWTHCDYHLDLNQVFRLHLE